MNIAILLGQSDYMYEKKHPVSKRDIYYMRKIIDNSDTFDKVLVLDDTFKRASQAKNKLSLFLRSCTPTDKSPVIDKVFIYFTGRIFFDGKEFFYLWSNYNRYRKRYTSILNSELDALIRQINPDNVVKVVDGCFSGGLYARYNIDLQKYLSSPKQSFKKNYYIYSAGNNSAMCGESSTVYFTKSFFQSLIKDINNIITYDDIIESISLISRNKDKKAPVCVINSDSPEEFCIINENIRTLVEKRKSILYHKQNSESVKHTLMDLIRMDAEKYIDLQTALSYYSKIGFIAKKAEIKHEIRDLFEKNIFFLRDYKTIPKIETILKWLSVNGSDIYIDLNHALTLSHKSTSTQNSFLSLSVASNTDNTAHRITSIENMSNPNIPYFAIKLRYNPRYPNIKQKDFYLIPLLAKSRIFLFYMKVNYNNLSWSKQEADIMNAKWSYIHFRYNDNTAIHAINNIINMHFDTPICNEIIKIFMPSENSYRLYQKKYSTTREPS